MQQIGRGASTTAPAKPDGHTRDLAGRSRMDIQETLRGEAGWPYKRPCGTKPDAVVLASLPTLSAFNNRLFLIDITYFRSANCK